MELNEKVALVTGAGSGIGRAIAELFALNGACVILSDINSTNIKTAADDITAKGGKAIYFAADVSQQDDVNALVDIAVSTYGRLDILVNNAGIMDAFTPVGDVTNDLWNRVLAVNVTGPFYLCRAAVKLFEQQGAGVIINVASVGGLNGGRAGAAYTASKHALIGLTKNIGYQYAQKGIRCNAIAPGGVETNIMQDAQINTFGYERLAAGMGNVTRSANASEIAEIAVFLASNRSSFINGSVITADGGWTAY